MDWISLYPVPYLYKQIKPYSNPSIPSAATPPSSSGSCPSSRSNHHPQTPPPGLPGFQRRPIPTEFHRSIHLGPPDRDPTATRRPAAEPLAPSSVQIERSSPELPLPRPHAAEEPPRCRKPAPLHLVSRPPLLLLEPAATAQPPGQSLALPPSFPSSFQFSSLSLSACSNRRPWSRCLQAADCRKASTPAKTFSSPRTARDFRTACVCHPSPSNTSVAVLLPSASASAAPSRADLLHPVPALDLEPATPARTSHPRPPLARSSGIVASPLLRAGEGGASALIPSLLCFVVALTKAQPARSIHPASFPASCQVPRRAALGQARCRCVLCFPATSSSSERLARPGLARVDRANRLAQLLFARSAGLASLSTNGPKPMGELPAPALFGPCSSPCYVAIVRIRSTTSVCLLHGLILLSCGISVAGADDASAGDASTRTLFVTMFRFQMISSGAQLGRSGI